ncbi:restriction endonuclease subunit S [Mycolicibacter senuensis]|uniref:restriction endonuclease subunit S n=1 Tax=Mycolicibacter senuensis TaxID=386913 RepID=UPI000A14DE9D|nr:restriction endonuclease subunit S [Mycolicibacter senuensis]
MSNVACWIGRPTLQCTGRQRTPSLRAFRLVDGDIVVAMDGALVGRSHTRISPSDLPAYLVQRVARLRGMSIHQELLHQWIASDHFVQHVDSVKTHTAIPHISPRDIRDFQLQIPASVREQQQIADALSDADKLVAALERLIAKKQTIKQGMMQQLLTGKTRLPGFAAPWKAVSVGDLMEFRNGLNKASQFFGSGTPIVNFMDVMNGPLITTRDVGGRVTLTGDEIKRFSAKRGDIFFTRTSETVEEVGTAAVLIDDIPNAAFSGFILRGRPYSGKCDSRFLAYMFQISDVRKQITASASCTTRALTNGKSLSQVVVQIPPVKEQVAITSVFEDVVREIAGLQRRLTKTHAIKRGMMQQLLTGRTRLPVLEP